MAKQKFTIKISGSGTADEIKKALKNVIESIEETRGDEQDAKLDGVEWEDDILMTSIDSE